MTTQAAREERARPKPRGLDAFFHLTERGTTIRREARAGLTTFLVMVYIIFVNPAILSFSGIKDLEPLGLPFVAVSAGTALLAGLLTIAMGLYANRPFALAAGLGLNAVAAFQLRVGEGMGWPDVMGVFVWEGAFITLLVLTNLRQRISEAIPMSLKQATGVGIGLFIMFIGFVQAGFITRGPSAADPVALADLTFWPVLVAVIGIVLVAVLHARRFPGALVVGILVSTVVSVIINYATDKTAFTTPGVAVVPDSLTQRPDFSLIGDFSLFGPFKVMGWGAVLAIFSIMLSDFFDTLGTVTGIASKAGWLVRGALPELKRVLLIDSLGAMFGGVFSTSSNTTYIESAAGVEDGAQTGLASVVTGLLFLAAVFVSPLAAIVPKEATAPALVLVGFLMFQGAREIDWDDFEVALPALFTMVVMPFTFSITNGVGFGFVLYAAIKLFRGKASDVHALVWLATAAFVIYFLWGTR